MTVAIANVEVSTDTWDDLINKLNMGLTALGNDVVTVGGDPSVGNSVIHGSISANTATFDTGIVVVLSSNTFTSNTANVNSGTVVTLTSNTGTFNNVTSNTANVNSGTVVTLTSNTANVNSGTVVTLTSNTATIATANIVSLSSNSAIITSLASSTANIDVINVISTLNVAVGSFKMSGGNTTAKFLITNGSGTHSYYQPVLADISDYASFSANVNSSISQVDGNALAYAIALG